MGRRAGISQPMGPSAPTVPNPKREAETLKPRDPLLTYPPFPCSEEINNVERRVGREGGKAGSLAGGREEGEMDVWPEFAAIRTAHPLFTR